MFPEMSKQCTLVDSPPIVFAESATSVAANCQYQGQCTVCVELIHEKRLIGDRRFVLMENCWDILCLQCTELLKLQRMDQILCPVCGTGSKGFVDLDRSVCSVEEKRRLFSNQTNATSLLQIEILTDSKELRCQLCSLIVRKNPDNPGSKFGILQYCRCIFCASCIAAKHNNSNKVCPVCLITSKQLVNHSEFVSLGPEKWILFQNKNKSSCLRCQLCWQVVRNNPGEQLFGILENCQCVFCADCIDEQRRITWECPICQTHSKTVLYQSKFISSREEKQSFYDNLLSSVRNLRSTPCAVDPPPTVESQLSQPTGQSLSRSTVVLSPNLLPVSTKVLNLTDQPPIGNSQLSQPTGQSMSLSSVVPSPNLLPVSTKVLNLTDQPPIGNSQLSQPTVQSMSLSTVVPSPNLLPVSTKASNLTDQPPNVECQLSQPGSSQSLSLFTVVPSPNLLPVSTKVLNLTDQSPNVESQLSQPTGQSKSLSTMVPSPNSLPLSSNLLQSIPKTITENSLLCPKPNVSKDSGLRCQLCSLEVRNNPANPDGKFGILQNCLCIFCASCIEANHSNRKKACPTCLVTSTRHVRHSEFVESESEKRKIFYKKTKDSELRCQLCLLEVQNNPANSGGQFAITTVCFCVICASCLSDDHRRSMKCPVCCGTSKRFEINSQFIRTIKDKQLLFQKISNNNQTTTSNILRSFDEEVLRCQLCSLEVQNNPANFGGQFGILRNCHCIFCASCIEAKHSSRKNKCPICLVTSRRLIRHSEFVESESEKSGLFVPKTLLKILKVSSLDCLIAKEVQPVLNSVDRTSSLQSTVESQLSQPGSSQSMSQSTVVTSPNSLPLSTNSRSIPTTINGNSVSCPEPNVPDSGLRCQLCTLEVQNNPANSGGQFAITTACFCVICASCITDDQRRLKKCPVCNRKSNRIENNSQFIRSEQDKQLVFNKPSKRRRVRRLPLSKVKSQLSQPGSSQNSLPVSTNQSIVQNSRLYLNSKDSGLRCKICLLEVQNNPANPGGQFAITTVCFCVICASCITDDHRQSMKCPVCNKTSRRIENYRKFIRSERLKQLFFDKISKHRQVRSPTYPTSTNTRSTTNPTSTNTRSTTYPTNTNARNTTYPTSTNTRSTTNPTSTNTRSTTYPTSTNVQGTTYPTSTNTRSTTNPTSTNTRSTTNPTSTNTRSTTYPTSTNTRSTTYPTSTNTRSTTHPTSTNTRSTTNPTSTNTRSTTYPTSTNTRSTTYPTSTNTRSTTYPTSTNTRSTTYPTSTNTRSTTYPTSTNTRSTTYPTSTNTRSTTYPTSTNTRSTTYPTSTNTRSTTYPTSTNTRSTTYPTSTNARSTTYPTSTNTRSTTYPTSTNTRSTTYPTSTNTRSTTYPTSTNTRSTTYPTSTNTRSTTYPPVTNTRFTYRPDPNSFQYFDYNYRSPSPSHSSYSAPNNQQESSSWSGKLFKTVGVLTVAYFLWGRLKS